MADVSSDQAFTISYPDHSLPVDLLRRSTGPFHASEQRSESNIVSWCFGGEGPPVLIPNTAVKLSTTDGTPQGEE